MQPPRPERRRMRRPLHVIAYGVHVLTAMGAAFGFLALKAAIDGDIALCFWWLAAALAVDAADGPLARRLNVKETASRYDGQTLDLVVDFITYVLVPAAALLRPEVLGGTAGLAAGLAIMLGSALYFADTRMKTADWWFQGFPACWNVVVFYIAAFKPAAPLALTVVALFCAAMFLPIVFVHPFRVRRFRLVTIAALVIWSAAALSALVQGLSPDGVTKAALLATAAYFLGLGAWRRKAPG
jgi:phosphatidylcholine synthase